MLERRVHEYQHCGSAGDVILNLDQAELQLQRVLAFSPDKAQLLRDHFMGCLWLLDTADTLQIPSSPASGHMPSSGALSADCSAACSALQYSRALGCLE